ncbi:hypothetical protein [uncultured Candidatus Kuenenia sp.]|uniref:hypothetical protein n=1 Tax=uncultured Candidatus Kuenenia sp. TaxID=1048336 RepID=UPI001D8C9820|nr:hypothetical protein [uncultured Candidatus Kuenenia sp.]TVM01169.1 MAG: hypothetical protein CV080_05655 [Candidatus Kuenenia stuttgartiensis]
MDFLEDSKDFKIEKVFEFCPNEQRAFGVEEMVKPIPLAIRCNPGEEAVLLSYEDGVWSWHFKNNDCVSNRDLVSDDGRHISLFSVPFKVQDRTTRGLWSKVVHVFKFATDWIQEGSSAAINNMLREYEGRKIKEGFKRIEHNLGFIEGLTTADPVSDWGGIKDVMKDKKKALLFIHGTGSSIEGGYADVPQKILAVLKNNKGLLPTEWVKMSEKSLATRN